MIKQATVCLLVGEVQVKVVVGESIRRPNQKPHRPHKKRQKSARQPVVSQIQMQKSIVGMSVRLIQVL